MMDSASVSSSVSQQEQSLLISYKPVRNSFDTVARQYTKGMGEAVADRTINRKRPDGTTEVWSDVAARVAAGNASLAPIDQQDAEFHAMNHHLRQGSLLMSGRHLQHGDLTQSTRPIEVFCNCSSAASTFLTLYLLLNGSGVGRSYDDAMMAVDWSNMPIVVPTIDMTHPDVQSGEINVPDYRSVQHIYAKRREHYFRVLDSREGWAQAFEQIEAMAYAGYNRDDVLILDFTDIRPRGAPIHGMQDRPAVGPGPTMIAVFNTARLRDAGMEPWRSAMFADHYVSESVRVGGVRRAARIACKTWRDQNVLDFIRIKQGGFLWSANNSVMVDREFWQIVRSVQSRDLCELEGMELHAARVFEAICHASYYDRTGEPGIINVDKLTWSNDNIGSINADFAGSSRYQMSEPTKQLNQELVRRWTTMERKVCLNPCQPGFATVLTPDGIRTFDDIDVGSLIWSQDGWVTVINKVATGVKPTYRYRTSAGVFYGTQDHRIVSDGVKIPVGEASAIDILVGGSYINNNKGTIKTMEPGPMINTSLGHIAAFLGGLFTKNGDVNNCGITLKLINTEEVEQVQIMLSALGVASSFVVGGSTTKEWYYNINIDQVNSVAFMQSIGFIQRYKQEKLEKMVGNYLREISTCDRPKITYEIRGVEYLGELPVYDITVSGVSHTYWTGGCNVSNCGEIVLNVLGAYCTLADVVPYHASGNGYDGQKYLDEWDSDAEDAFRVATRSLIRTNTMEALYGQEVVRTNRIGVGLTGVHEYAWSRFGFGFHDLIDEDKSQPFWQMISKFKRAVQNEAHDYSQQLGVVEPHTNTTCKPSGSVSKLFGLTEGVHLPSMREFIRWVQFKSDDPLIDEYRAKGYPVRELKTYHGSTIVGFPTQPEICRLGMKDKLITAAEATPAEQYQWLRLLEKYWLTGVEEDGVTALEERGNQLSYTLKYKPDELPYEQFRQAMLDGQSTVRCCSVMPQETGPSPYEYLPEQPVTKHEFEVVVQAIRQSDIKEDVDRVHVECAGGSCPISFEKS